MLRDSIWLFVYLPLFTLFSLLANSEANSAISQQVDQRPVDRRVPLEEISTDFEMADSISVSLRLHFRKERARSIQMVRP